ncbi:MAG: hypothetical protein NW241_12300 [Bacteroidia bacterium]|nr:hypothetical protein [Bacteroidia bacterium]
MILDTQIISYYFSGYWEAKEAMNAEISSVTASEFLLFHTRENNSVDYYVLDPERYIEEMVEMLMLEHAKNPKWAKLGRRRTDSLIIDFSKDFPPYRLYGNKAITSIINNQKIKIFKASIAHLKKERQKMLSRKIEFLFDYEIKCHGIDESVCNIGMDLFEKFQSNISPKNNIKNTINDILILATSANMKQSLVTQDKVLGRFASEVYNGKIEDYKTEIMIDFPSDESKIERKNKESKGYVNRGWSYSFKKGKL